MIKYGIITGASSGIGKELAKIHASKGKNIILIARSENDLNELAEELKSKFKVEAKVLCLDLIQEDAVSKIQEFVTENKIQVDYLFNNAGFGGFGVFSDRNLKEDLDMIDLNIKALVKLCHFFINHMKEIGGGKILNVASTAGFIPGPLQATYFATKAFVVSFSQAIAEENKHLNITVSALCPGPVATKFAETAKMGDSNMFKNAKSPVKVAASAYKGMEKGKLIIFDDWKLNFGLNWIVPLLPRKLVLKTVKKMQAQ